MGTNDHGLVALPWNGGDHARLAPWVLEDIHMRAVLCRAGQRDCAIDERVEPCGAFGAVLGPVVASVEGGEFLKVLAHVLLGQVFHQRDESAVVGRCGGVDDFGLGREGAGGPEVGGVGYVHELKSLLESRVSIRSTGHCGGTWGVC